jgi:C2 domain
VGKDACTPPIARHTTPTADAKPAAAASNALKTSERRPSLSGALPPPWGDSPAFRALLLVHRDQQRLEVVCVAPSSARMYALAQKLLLTIEDLLVECGIADVRRFVSCRHCVDGGNEDPVVFPVEGKIVSVLDSDKAAAEADADNTPVPDSSPSVVTHSGRTQRNSSLSSSSSSSHAQRSSSGLSPGLGLKGSARSLTATEAPSALKRAPQNYRCENVTSGFVVHLSTMFRPKARLEVNRLEVVNLPQPQLFGMVSISPNPYVVVTVSTAVRETEVRTNTDSATWSYDEPLRFQLQPGVDQLLEIQVWSRHTMVNDVVRVVWVCFLFLCICGLCMFVFLRLHLWVGVIPPTSFSL